MTVKVYIKAAVDTNCVSCCKGLDGYFGRLTIYSTTRPVFYIVLQLVTSKHPLK